MAVLDKAIFVEGLAASHGEQLRCFLSRRVRNASDMPDLVQEVYLRLLRVPNHEAIRSPEAYLFTVARHVAQQHALREASMPASGGLDTPLLTSRTDSDPASEVSAQQSLENLELALEDLPAKARATFLLHRRDGLTLEEVGARLGFSRAQAKKYLAKALIRLRERLNDDGAGTQGRLYAKR